MAVIGQIQKNSYLLLGVIGLAMLAFIFTDSFKNVGGDEPMARAEMFGDAIDEQELSEMEDVFVDRDKQTASYEGKEYSTQNEQDSRDQAFNELVRKKLMSKELEALGLKVSSLELSDMITGDNIHPWVSQINMFKDGLGQYSKDSVIKFIDNLSMEVDPIDTARFAQWKDARKRWSGFEKDLKNARITDKYVSLVTKGLFVNSLEAKNKYVSETETRDISFVMHKYSSILETEIVLSEDDLKAYYEIHKNDKEYQPLVESAEIEFVQFPVAYSQSDAEKLYSQMDRLKDGFRKSKNNVYFMATKGEDKFYNDTMTFDRGTDALEMDSETGKFLYPANIDSEIQNSSEGDVIGPFKTINNKTEKDAIFIAKVTGFEVQPRAWVRHILISTSSKSEDEAKNRADSLVRVIKSKNNFSELVAAFSDDPGSVASNGEYKWFKEGDMVPEFNDAAFNGSIGKIQLIKTTFGYHIVEVLGRENRKLPKLAPIRKTIKPSIETINEVENLAYEFINSVSEENVDSAFYNVADVDGLVYTNSKLFVTSNFVNGFENTSKIRKFAFAKDAKIGDVSETILDNGSIKVAFLVNKIAVGTPEFGNVKLAMKQPALREKQTKAYSEIMNKSNNLNEIASSLIGGIVENAAVKFNSSTIPGTSTNESDLIGAVFSISKENEGAVLKPIQGSKGIYVVAIDKINEAPEIDNYLVEATTLQGSLESKADGAIIKALRERADVKDNRLIIDAKGR